jgi:hypothetical protein
MKKSKNLLMASAICFALSGVHLFAMDDAIDDEGHEAEVPVFNNSNHPDGDDPGGGRMQAEGGFIELPSGNSTCPGLGTIIDVPAEDLPKCKASQNKEEVLLIQLETTLEAMINFEQGQNPADSNYFGLTELFYNLQDLVGEIVQNPDDENRTKKQKLFMCCVLLIRQHWNVIELLNKDRENMPNYVKELIGRRVDYVTLQALNLNLESLLESLLEGFIGSLEFDPEELSSEFKEKMPEFKEFHEYFRPQSAYLDILNIAREISDDMFTFCFKYLRMLRTKHNLILKNIPRSNLRSDPMTLIEEIVAFGQLDMLRKLRNSGRINLQDLESDTISPLLTYPVCSPLDINSNIETAA